MHRITKNLLYVADAVKGRISGEETERMSYYNRDMFSETAGEADLTQPSKGNWVTRGGEIICRTGRKEQGRGSNCNVSRGIRAK